MKTKVFRPVFGIIALLCTIVLVGAEAPTKTTTPKAVLAHARISQVRVNTKMDVSGKRIYELSCKTTQTGAQFFGTLRLTCEVSDSAGKHYFGSASFPQQHSYSETTECEWAFQIQTEGIKNPALTGYCLQYLAPGATKPLAEHFFGCEGEKKLKSRNEKSNPLSVSGFTFKVIGGNDRGKG